MEQMAITNTDEVGAAPAGAEIAFSPTFEELKWEDEKHQRERAVLFQNEGFALGALHTVSAAASFGIVNQMAQLKPIAGVIAPVASLTMLVLALALSVAAAYYRHEYKKWDVKGRAIAHDPQKVKQQTERAVWSSRDLERMREFMGAATTLVIGALLYLVGAMWLKVFGLF